MSVLALTTVACSNRAPAPNRAYSPTPAATPTAVPEDFSQRAEAGEYPHEWLPKHPEIGNRLAALMGADERRFQRNFGVEVPLEKRQGHLILQGCRPHDCGRFAAALVLPSDLSVLHVLVYDNGSLRTWSENDEALPDIARQLAEYWDSENEKEAA